ncbi:MAG: 16S rRNA processing protein RimM [Clostridia bacterium]|nr:16S rRNA processing protein RimM [Clostridia bacterium]
MLKNLLIGEVVSVHGVRGGLKVKPMTDYPERFTKTEAVDVKLPSDSGPYKGLSGRYKVSYATVSGNSVILLLDGVYDRNTAELFRGAMLSVTRDEAVKLPEDTYFIGDLIGSTVYEFTDGADENLFETDAKGVALLGKLFEVLPTGSNDVYGVRTPDNKEMYIPSIGDVIRHVDVERGLVFVKLLPGLKEVYLEG